MYSRNPAPPPNPVPMGRPSYVRSHNARPNFNVPLNYSGNAFLSRSADGGYTTLPQEPYAAEPIDTLPPEVEPDVGEPEMLKEEMPSHREPERTVMNLQHFPFGHGIGFEELLLLGLIFFLLQEGEGQQDRGDLDETVLLLAILLFCG